MNIGDKIKELREKRDLTQDQLASILDLSRSTIGMYERDERQPGYELLIKIADYFNVTTDYLLGRTENKNELILTNDNLHVPEEYKDLEIKIGVDKDKYPKEGFTVEQVKAILDRFYKAGMIIQPKDDDKNNP